MDVKALIVRSAGVTAAVVALLALGIACGGSSSVDGASKTADRDSKFFRWGVIFTPSPRVIKVGGGIGYCVGDTKPRLARPHIEYQGEDVYIRLSLRMPKQRQSKDNLCAGVELLVMRKIRLQRDLSDLRLYDSGVEPPELRWPK